MTFLKRHQYTFFFVLILFIAIFLRFYGLMDSGFKFTDEGYHFFPAIDLYNAIERGTTHFLTWYHGLEFWICLGAALFGFTYNGALLWAATCGTLAVPFFYLFSVRLFSKQTALLCSFAFAFNYYLVFYARTALSTGYAVFFLCWFLFVFERAMFLTGVFGGNCEKCHSSLKKHSALFLVGVFLGMLTHIRIELGFIGIGFIGALGIVVILQYGFSNILKLWRRILIDCIPLFILLGYAILVYMLFFVFLYSLDWVDWENSWVFYRGHLGFAKGSDQPWKPYLLIEIWRLAGIPFLVFSLWGLFSETVLFKRLSMRRKWFLISFWGLTVFLLKTGLPYPRTYVYTVLFLCAYWGIGVRRIVAMLPRTRSCRVFRLCMVVFLLLSTFFCEFYLIKPLFQKRSRYDEAERFIARRGPGNIHGTHSWPIFELLPFKYKRYIVYDTYRHFHDYEDFCLALKDAYENQSVKYMVLDNNISYFGGNDIKMIQQFAATVLPDAVFQNDYGDDWHTCMDAFGKPPIRNMFTNRVMVYDMRNFAKIPREPIPFFGEERMNQIFTERWAEKETQADSKYNMGKEYHGKK